MSKTLENKSLSERPGSRMLLAVSLCGAMAAFGCTTDRTLGNGDPIVTPGVRTTPTGSSTGSESGALPPPMMSSSTATPKALLVTPAQAAAIMARSQSPRVKVLGQVAPAGSSAYASDRRSSAALATARTATVNNSINGARAAGLAAVGENLGGETREEAEFLSTVGDAIDAGVVNVGTASGSPIVTNPSAPNVTTPTAPSPTGSSVFTPNGTLGSATTLSPTASSVQNPPASISGANPGTVQVTNTANGGVAVTNTTSTGSSSSTSSGNGNQ